MGVAAEIVSIRGYPDLVLPEEGSRSYAENALAKARVVHAALSAPALADDSGLEVDALDGAPGIRSARFAGEGADDRANIEALLAALRGVPAERRTARFRCVIALVRCVRDEIVVEGICEGRILGAPRGTEGFGYDPLFVPDGATDTFAGLPAGMKNRISHRARAAEALRASLRRDPGAVGNPPRSD